MGKSKKKRMIHRYERLALRHILVNASVGIIGGIAYDFWRSYIAEAIHTAMAGMLGWR